MLRSVSKPQSGSPEYLKVIIKFWNVPFSTRGLMTPMSRASSRSASSISPKPDRQNTPVSDHPYFKRLGLAAADDPGRACRISDTIYGIAHANLTGQGFVITVAKGTSPYLDSAECTRLYRMITLLLASHTPCEALDQSTTAVAIHICLVYVHFSYHCPFHTRDTQSHRRLLSLFHIYTFYSALDAVNNYLIYTHHVFRRSVRTRCREDSDRGRASTIHAATRRSEEEKSRFPEDDQVRPEQIRKLCELFQRYRRVAETT